jgi:putative membrane protein
VMWWGDGMGWGAGFFGWMFMLGFWALAIVGIVLVIRALSDDRGRSHHGAGQYGPPPGPPPPGAPHRPSAWLPPAPGTAPPPQPPLTQGGQSETVAILEERYARGEIDREEFLRRKADLQG